MKLSSDTDAGPPGDRVIVNRIEVPTTPSDAPTHLALPFVIGASNWNTIMSKLC